VFFPAGKKSYEKAVKYEGNRDLDDLVRFANSELAKSLPAKFEQLVSQD
jgi:hypothetical protein